MTVPVVLAAVCVGAQRVADEADGPLHLGVGGLVVCRADDEARAHALDEGAEHLARELGVMVHNERVGKPGTGPQAHVANDHSSVRRRRRRARGDGVRWHERTYSATLQSWPTDKARRRTSDPLLAYPKCPPSGPHGSRGAPVRAARRRRGCRGDPHRPVRGGRGGCAGR